MKRVATMLALTGALAAPEASGNDTRVANEGGQLRFVASEGIVMEEEILTISGDRISVDYLFRNMTRRPITTEVGFPVRIPRDEGADEDDVVRPREWTPLDGRDPTFFQLTVDGETRRFRSLWRGSQAEVEILHVWDQTFPPGTPIRVSHRYFPSGRRFGPAGAGDPRWKKLAREYCVGPKLATTMRHATLIPVTYILTTGANWSGPIRRFHLILRKSTSEQRVSLCLDGLKKTSDTTFELERSNFTPTSDLRLVFLDPVECVERTPPHAPVPCP